MPVSSTHEPREKFLISDRCPELPVDIELS